MSKKQLSSTVLVFKNVKVLGTSYYQNDVPGFAGEILAVDLEIENQHFLLINGGPTFKFNESVSFLIEANTQDEIDYYWTKLDSRRW